MHEVSLRYCDLEMDASFSKHTIDPLNNVMTKEPHMVEKKRKEKKKEKRKNKKQKTMKAS
jgi:uncharacterized coiled-coil protein SlyX